MSVSDLVSGWTDWLVCCVLSSGIAPHQLDHVQELVEPLEQSVWELLYSRYGTCYFCEPAYSITDWREKDH